jgi:hypothetical protein
VRFWTGLTLVGVTVAPEPQPDPRDPRRSRRRSREEILAAARPLPADWGFDDLTEDERESFLAAVADR